MPNVTVFALPARRTLTIAALAATTLGVGLMTAPGAQAATVKTLPTQTLRAYSVNGYKATIAPKYTLPKGTVKVSATVTVSKGGVVKARKVASYRAAAGTYAATSAVKYRSKTAYTAYKTHSATAYAESCTVTAASVDPSSVEHYGDYANYMTNYTGTCKGTEYDTSAMRTGTFTGRWTEYESTYTPGASDPTPNRSIGEPVDYPGATGTLTWKTKYTAYRYGAVKSLSTRRTVVVTKVVNTPVMTRAEFNSIREGDSLTRVRAIVGSNGKLTYDDRSGFLGKAYEWKNTSGGTTWVWFLNGRVTSFNWYAF